MTQKFQRFIFEKNNREEMENNITLMTSATLQIPKVMTGDKELKMEVTVDEHTTVKDILNQVNDPELKKKLFDQRGDPNKFLAVMLNGKSISYANGMETIVKGSDKLMVLPLVSGGSI